MTGKKVKAKNGERVTKVCPVCNEQFKVKPHAKAMSQKFCSRDCHQKSRVTLPLCICINCGNEFQPKFADRMNYCSKQCKFEYHASQRAKRTAEKEYDKHLNLAIKLDTKRICKYCGKTYKHTKKREQSKYCSKECHTAWYARLTFRANTIAKDQSTLPVKCKMCGEMFKPVYGDKKKVFCSKYCRQKFARGNQKKSYLYRMREKFRYIQNVNRYYVFKRDNYICHICGTPLDMNATPSTPLYPSIDHIVPLSKGGTHEYSNVKAAHFICNSYRGNRETFDINKVKRFLKESPKQTPMVIEWNNQRFTDMVKLVFGGY